MSGDNLGLPKQGVPVPAGVGHPCKGCGNAVFDTSKYCETCKAKDWAKGPKASLETGAQPTPAYQRDTPEE